ncbi:MAG: hypothetical protein K2X68_10175 [Novosphingobium sp.]|nr:hypothetical protein [Novosphingobium sp.]
MMHSLIRATTPLFLAVSVPAIAIAEEFDKYAPINVGTNLDYHAHIGRLRAGKPCLPNKTLYFDEIFVSKSRLNELGYLVFRDLADGKFKSSVQRTGLSILLVDVDAKLCAKSWGFFGSGARNQLSGSVRLVYQWAQGSAPLAAAQTIDVEIPSDQARSKDTIARYALETAIAALAKQAGN